MFALSNLFVLLAVTLVRIVGSLHVSDPRLSKVIDTGDDTYSTNLICKQNNCVNPIFPGLNDLERLEGLSWQCPPDTPAITSHLDFCLGAVPYSPAIPSPENTAQELGAIVRAQDAAAQSMFFYHMSAIGYDAWELQKPPNTQSACVVSVWKMVCYTYFPKAQAGCNANQSSPYMRPCMSGCMDYLRACNVECCDEGNQCVFDRSSSKIRSDIGPKKGYVSENSPSAVCTGIPSSGMRIRAPLGFLLLVLGLNLSTRSTEERKPTKTLRKTTFAPAAISLLLVLLSLCLQGCSIPHHNDPTWTTKDDYLWKFGYEPPNGALILNSCSQNISKSLQCSGRGYCRVFSLKPHEALDQVGEAFCVCEQDYADPECKTRRKSQVKAFFISFFGGFLGLDYFYLGFPVWGVCKLFTLGGFGCWWLLDIIRMGAGPVYAVDFRVSPDLSRLSFLIFTVSMFTLLGLVLSMLSYFASRRQKRRMVMKMLEGEEARHWEANTASDHAMKFGGKGGNFQVVAGALRGYGTLLPSASAGRPASWVVL